MQALCTNWKNYALQFSEAYFLVLCSDVYFSTLWAVGGYVVVIVSSVS